MRYKRVIAYLLLAVCLPALNKVMANNRSVMCASVFVYHIRRDGPGASHERTALFSKSKRMIEYPMGNVYDLFDSWWK